MTNMKIVEVKVLFIEVKNQSSQ